MNHSRDGRSSRRTRDTDSMFPPPFNGGVSSNKAFPSEGDNRGICTAVIGSMTQAMRARDALGEAAIRATVVKVSSSATHNGCAYGVEFPCVQQANVRDVLRSAGITVRGIQ